MFAVSISFYLDWYCVLCAFRTTFKNYCWCIKSSVHKTSGKITFGQEWLFGHSCSYSREISSLSFDLIAQRKSATPQHLRTHHHRHHQTKMMCLMKSVVAVLMVGSMILVNRVDCGSCRESTLCCNGRDSSCVVQKAPINSIIEDLNDKPCYCDHACLRLGDCCSDFKQYCGGK